MLMRPHHLHPRQLPRRRLPQPRTSRASLGLLGRGLGLGRTTHGVEDLGDDVFLLRPRTGLDAECSRDGDQLLLVLRFEHRLFECVCGHENLLSGGGMRRCAVRARPPAIPTPVRGTHTDQPRFCHQAETRAVWDSRQSDHSHGRGGWQRIPVVSGVFSGAPRSARRLAPRPIRSATAWFARDVPAGQRDVRAMRDARRWPSSPRRETWPDGPWPW